jgi:hypothetical protein
MRIKRAHRGLIGLLLCAAQVHAQFNWQMNAGEGTLTLLDRDIKVLTYRYGDQLKTGVAVQYERACYIHPLAHTPRLRRNPQSLLARPQTRHPRARLTGDSQIPHPNT